MSARQKLAVLISCSGHGGVERMVANLLRELAVLHDDIDLLLLKDKSPHLKELPEHINRIKLKSNSSLLAIPELTAYLKRVQPTAMLVAKDRAGRAALRARQLAGVNTRICIRLGTNLSAALANKNLFNRWLRQAPMKKLYKLADCVIAVSEGVRQDTIDITGISPANTKVIRNPVITNQLAIDSEKSCEHNWLEDKDLPVVVGAGRLSEQKDFSTLIAAFDIVRKKLPCRLLILGEGALRGSLQSQIEQLGLEDFVQLPGFQSNLYAWLSKADLFVLSSRWEGSPNVLSEALALGIPSVSTRCPSGPEEVLQQGKYGFLVDVGNVQQMADAMLSTLENPLPADEIKNAVNEYRAEVSAKHYLETLFEGL